MIGRRRFLQLGPATLTGALVLDWDKAIGAAGAGGPGQLGRGIFDQRFAESRAFGQSLAAHGVQTTAAGDDIARLWYDDLRPSLQKASVPFAGLTDRSTVFCLEELARDVGMKVVTRIDHVMEPNGEFRHDAVASSFIVETLRESAGFGQLAALLLMNESQHASHPDAQKRTGPAAPENTTALVTWVIA